MGGPAALQGAVVVTGDDAELVKEQAERIGQYFWDVHDRFEFVAPVARWKSAWPLRGGTQALLHL